MAPPGRRWASQVAYWDRRRKPRHARFGVGVTYERAVGRRHLAEAARQEYYVRNNGFLRMRADELPPDPWIVQAWHHAHMHQFELQRRVDDAARYEAQLGLEITEGGWWDELLAPVF